LALILCGFQRFFDIFYLSLILQRRIGTLGGIPAQNVAKDRYLQGCERQRYLCIKRFDNENSKKISIKTRCQKIWHLLDRKE